MAEKFFNDEQALLASGEPLIEQEEIAFDKVSNSKPRHSYFQDSAARFAR